MLSEEGEKFAEGVSCSHPPETVSRSVATRSPARTRATAIGTPQGQLSGAVRQKPLKPCWHADDKIHGTQSLVNSYPSLGHGMCN